MLTNMANCCQVPHWLPIQRSAGLLVAPNPLRGLRSVASQEEVSPSLPCCMECYSFLHSIRPFRAKRRTYLESLTQVETQADQARCRPREGTSLAHGAHAREESGERAWWKLGKWRRRGFSLATRPKWSFGTAPLATIRTQSQPHRSLADCSPSSQRSPKTSSQHKG